jgi:transposase
MKNEDSQTKLFSEDKIRTVKQKRKRKVVFKPYSQNQQFLMPKNIDDFIGDGHIARFISQIVDEMDVDFILDTYQGGGTSSYNPRMMLKCWVLGFVYRIYSCRLLAKSTRENLAFIWISGNQTPDFRTLNNFRLRLTDDIKQIFKQIVLYGMELGIIKGEDVFVDHTKNQANANRYKVIWKKQVNNQLEKIDAELNELFRYIDEINENEEKTYGAKDLPEQERKGFDKTQVSQVIDKINKKVKEGNISKEEGKGQREKVGRAKELSERKESYENKKKIFGDRNSYSKTDTDAVAMMMKDKKIIRPAYNEGIMTENGIVLNYIIDDNASDSVSFIPLMKGTIDNLGKAPERINGDGAYGNEENSMFLEEKDIENFLKYNTYHNEKSQAWLDKKIRRNDFAYNEKNDEFTCKNGSVLSFVEESTDETATEYVKNTRKYSAGENGCNSCPFKDKCTKSNARILEVNWNGERLRRIARENLDSDKGKELRKRRGNEVESVFGDQKMNNRKRHYQLRGMKKVNLEAGLYYISHNLRKIHSLVGNKTKMIEINGKTGRVGSQLNN